MATFEHVMMALQGYIRTGEALAALGARLGAASGKLAPSSKLLSKLDAVRAQHEPDLITGLSADELDTIYASVRASLRQMVHLVELTDDRAEGWTYSDPGILQAQGRSSRLVTRLLTDYASKDRELARTLSGRSAFLDVGSGVGWISLSMAQQWPNLRATGIDILDPALELARQNLDETGLAGRVTFRKQNVVELADTEAFDLAFIPAVFIPEEILAEGLYALRLALKPGGWLFVAAYRIPEDPKLAVLNDLRTTLSGGRVWEIAELEGLVRSVGLDVLGDIGTNSPLHLLAARRGT